MIFKFQDGTDTPEAGQYIIKNITERNQLPKCTGGFSLLLVVWRKFSEKLRPAVLSFLTIKNIDLPVHC